MAGQLFGFAKSGGLWACGSHGLVVSSSTSTLPPRSGLHDLIKPEWVRMFNEEELQVGWGGAAGWLAGVTGWPCVGELATCTECGVQYGCSKRPDGVTTTKASHDPTFCSPLCPPCIHSLLPRRC